MDWADRQGRGGAWVLRARLARLSEASPRVNESLDVGVVLREVIESARALTGARYGAIILLDDAGRAEDVLSSV